MRRAAVQAERLTEETGVERDDESSKAGGLGSRQQRKGHVVGYRPVQLVPALRVVSVCSCHFLDRRRRCRRHDHRNIDLRSRTSYSNLSVFVEERKYSDGSDQERRGVLDAEERNAKISFVGVDQHSRDDSVVLEGLFT